MPLQFTYLDRTLTSVEHERGKYICPFFSKSVKNKFVKQSCPVHHKRARAGGCAASMPLSTRTSTISALHTERMNSQAINLGIEHPHFRNGSAIANLNTLTYALINLRLLLRVRLHLKADS
jgi:hypothetical protein